MNGWWNDRWWAGRVIGVIGGGLEIGGGAVLGGIYSGVDYIE